MGKRILVADFDPQANLTSMFLTEPELEKLWDPDNTQDQSVMAPLSPIIRGLGDIGRTPLQRIAPNIRLIPGDLNLSNFESNLSEAWGDCLDGKEPAFRTTSSLYRITRQAAEQFDADLVLIDVGPNFGAINRAALICADAVVIPVAPDLFSIQGLRNLGPTLKNWRREMGKAVGRKSGAGPPAAGGSNEAPRLRRAAVRHSRQQARERIRKMGTADSCDLRRESVGDTGDLRECGRRQLPRSTQALPQPGADGDGSAQTDLPAQTIRRSHWRAHIQRERMRERFPGTGLEDS
jgi:cellulose biosynthesis protein BcsQ